MESVPTPARVLPPLDEGLLAAAAHRAVAAAREIDEPARAIDEAVGVFYDAVGGILPSVFLLDHGRFWLVAQRGHVSVPDAIRIVRGVMGRAVRLGTPQLVPDVTADPDYFAVFPGIVSELAVPLRAGRVIVGALNLESERALPDGAAAAVRPLAAALGPRVEELRTSRTVDLAALARLSAHLGSLRDPDEIAALAVTSLPKILAVEASQLIIWGELDAHATLAAWRSDGAGEPPFLEAELEAARALVDPSLVCQVLGVGGARERSRLEASIVWLPLRANGEELGALVGRSGAWAQVDSAQLDTAALLAAHVAASLDAAFALRRERHSAVTDSLTGILNRRGLEEVLERELALAQERRIALSLVVIDCDDFKEINDRAGHAFGDALLREIADVLVAAIPEGALAARPGGDEFVVMLPGADADAAEALGGRIRKDLAAGLTDAGFPLRMSAGISTYPFDGAGSTGLLRAADQALYAAKSSGKDRVASFREITGSSSPDGSVATGAAVDVRRRGRGDASGSVLADALVAVEAIEREDTVDGVCDRVCKSLVFVVGATACSASRVRGEYLVDATEHALREVSLGNEAAYRIADFPLSADVLRTGTPQAISFAEGDVDPAEAFILRELGMNALLLLPLRVDGRPWGLIELYEMRMRVFTNDDIAIARFLTRQAERRIAVVGSTDELRPRPPVYELPSEREAPRTPWTR